MLASNLRLSRRDSRGIAPVLMPADESDDTPAAWCHLAAMQIGDILIYGGQRYLVCGFDPEGVSARLIYLESIATGLRWALPFAEAGLPEKFGGLRLVTETESDESGSDV